jgi:predicted site-specific integrase-resolvase
MDDIKKWKEWMDREVMTLSEAREYLGMSTAAFTQSLRTGRIKPIYERGDGTRKIRLFLREDVEKYKLQVKKNRKRIGWE